jgi:c-di-GMP-binding flagellar brake protein YcgR
METDAPATLVDQVGDDDKFRIYSRMEIVNILQAVAADRELVSIGFGGSQDFILSAILAVNPDFEEVVLDYGADQAAMQKLLASNRLRFTTQLDHVRILFQTDLVAATSFEGSPAFRTPLPASLLRLQRRDAYRLKIPLSRPVMCDMPAADTGAGRVRVRVRDISAGGVGLVDYPPSMRLVPGTVRKDCRIVLPELGTLTADLEVMHATADVESRRCGCRFVGLSQAMANLIQRYITKIEREQHQTQ